MQFGLTYGVVNDRALGLNDTRRIVSSLAAIAPSLGDLGIGGGLATSTGSPGGYIILVHPRGNKDSIQAGELLMSWPKDSLAVNFVIQMATIKPPPPFGQVSRML